MLLLLDLIFCIVWGLCSRIQLSHKESHLKDIKNFLSTSEDLKDWFCHTMLLVTLLILFDMLMLDVRYLVNVKSNSIMAHFLGPCFVSWVIKKQNFMALSIAEAEYVVFLLIVLSFYRKTIN